MTPTPISILIKTFERPKSLNALLRSFRDLHVDCPILIADDSRLSGESTVKKMFPDLQIQYFNLPFDTGLSKGRNILLSHVKTPYFLLCDDDFVFDKRTNLHIALENLVDHSLDIVGGDFYNYIKITGLETLSRHLKRPRNMIQFFFNNYKTSRYIGKFEINGDALRLSISNKYPSTSPFSCDLVNNFFLAKTKSVTEIGGWDPELKLGEHEDFFLRAKKSGLKVAYLPGFGTRHYPVIKSGYKTFRLRALEYKKKFVVKYGFKKYQEVNADSGEVLFEF